MFCLNIALGNLSWRLLFKEKGVADAVYSTLAQPLIENVMVEDDYGQQFCAKRDSIHGFMLEDMDKTKLAHIEMALHQARTQSAATKAAQADLGLRADATRQSPAILNPMGNGARPF